MKRILLSVLMVVLTVGAIHAQSKNAPTLAETLLWMHNFAADNGSQYTGQNLVDNKACAPGPNCQQRHDVSTFDSQGCAATITWSITLGFKNNGTYTDQVSLKDLDPNSVQVVRDQPFENAVHVEATNSVKAIAETMSLPTGYVDHDKRTWVELVFDNKGDAERFAKAFKHAVEACGGKPSLFADSDGRDDRELPTPGGVAAQSAPPRKDIPAIAKAANGAIVSIVMSDKDGKPIAQGSGFLVSPDGVIVTNYHVIETGNIAIVKFPDDTAFPVDGVLAADKVRDLAIIKIHGKTFRTLALGDSDDIEVGEEVVAIGNPLSLESTVSNGIISGVRTSKEQGGKFLQTTAPISPGSSGGPLFNMLGEVVGINTMYLEGGENLNFAIPVNEAKLLLSHQSAKLRNLPNERESAPTNAPPSTTGEGLIAQTKQTEETYYVRANRNGTYIIEYRGHQLTAHCRESLTWLDGKDKLGSPMAVHECVYMSSTVGKYIGEDLMVWQDNELRYRPWADIETAAQTADILDITDDVLLAGPKHLHPSPKTSPDIQKTMHWVQNTLNDEEGKTFYAGKDGKTDIRVNLMPELNGCQVTFVYETREETKEDSKATFRSRNQINLGDLDPTSLEADTVAHDVIGPVSIVTVHTTDKVPSVNLAPSDRGWEPARVISTTDLVWELPSPYAERFVKALHRAITLCGGKASTF